MTKFELVIKNKDGSVYWTERFEFKADLNKWLKEEQSKIYWKKDFVVEIADNSEAIEKEEQETKARVEAEIKKQETLREELKVLRKSPPKTVADLALALDKVLTFLGIEKAGETVRTK